MLSCSFGLVRYSRYCLGSIKNSSIFCIAKDIIIRINMRMRCHPRGNVNPSSCPWGNRDAYFLEGCI